jgi:molybdopterin adenylyltransferase
LSDAASAHRAYAPGSVGCAVITVSDSRALEDDASGKLVRELLEAASHRVALHAIVKDDRDEIREAVLRGLARNAVEAVIVTGGTGVSPRDVTPEAIEALFEKPLAGFGEIFRMLSFQEIGAAALLSRASAGTTGGKVVFVLPGSTGAVRLAVQRLIAPELGPLIGQLRRKDHVPSAHAGHARK